MVRTVARVLLMTACLGPFSGAALSHDLRQQALQCAAGQGCDGLGVTSEEAQRLLNTTPAQAKIDHAAASAEDSAKNAMSFDEDEVSGDAAEGEDLFEQAEAENDGDISFTEKEAAYPDSEGAPDYVKGLYNKDGSVDEEYLKLFKCAAGYGCEGMDLASDEAAVTLVVTTEQAQAAYEAAGGKVPENKSNKMSFDEDEVSGDAAEGEDLFEQAEDTDSGDMAFTDEQAAYPDGKAPDYAKFLYNKDGSVDDEALGAYKCAAGYGCGDIETASDEVAGILGVTIQQAQAAYEAAGGKVPVSKPNKMSFDEDEITDLPAPPPGDPEPSNPTLREYIDAGKEVPNWIAKDGELPGNSTDPANPPTEVETFLADLTAQKGYTTSPCQGSLDEWPNFLSTPDFKIAVCADVNNGTNCGLGAANLHCMSKGRPGAACYGVGTAPKALNINGVCENCAAFSYIVCK